MYFQSNGQNFHNKNIKSPEIIQHTKLSKSTNFVPFHPQFQFIQVANENQQIKGRNSPFELSQKQFRKQDSANNLFPLTFSGTSIKNINNIGNHPLLKKQSWKNKSRPPSNYTNNSRASNQQKFIYEQQFFGKESNKLYLNKIDQVSISTQNMSITTPISYSQVESEMEYPNSPFKKSSTMVKSPKQSISKIHFNYRGQSEKQQFTPKIQKQGMQSNSVLQELFSLRKMNDLFKKQIQTLKSQSAQSQSNGMNVKNIQSPLSFTKNKLKMQTPKQQKHETIRKDQNKQLFDIQKMENDIKRKTQLIKYLEIQCKTNKETYDEIALKNEQIQKQLSKAKEQRKLDSKKYQELARQNLYLKQAIEKLKDDLSLSKNERFIWENEQNIKYKQLSDWFLAKQKVLKQQKEKLSSTIQSLNCKIQQMVKNNEVDQSEIAVLFMKLQTYQNKLQHQININTECQSMIKELQNQILQLKQQQSNFIKENRLLTENNSIVKRQNQQIKIQFDNYRNRLLEKQRESDIYKDLIQVQVIQKQQLRQNFSSKISQLINQIKILHAELKAKQQQQEKKYLKQTYLQENIQLLEQKLINLNHYIKSLEEKIKQSNEQLQIYIKTENQLKYLIQLKQSIISQTNQSLQQINNEVKTLQIQHSNKDAQINRLHHNISQMKDQIFTLEQKMNQNKQTIAQKSKEISKLKQVNIQLQKRISQLNQIISIEMSWQELYEKSKKQNEIQLIKFQQAIQDFKQKYEQITSSYQKEIITKQNQLNSLKRNYQILEQSNNQKQQSLNQLHSQQEKLIKQMQQQKYYNLQRYTKKQEQYFKLHQQTNVIKTQKHQLQKQILKLSSTIEQNIKRQILLRDQMQLIKQQSKNKIQSSKNTIQELKQAIDNYCQKIKQLQQKQSKLSIVQTGQQIINQESKRYSRQQQNEEQEVECLIVSLDALIYICELLNIEINEQQIIPKIIQKLQNLSQKQQQENQIKYKYNQIAQIFGIQSINISHQQLLEQISSLRDNLKFLIDEARQYEQQLVNFQKQNQDLKTKITDEQKKYKVLEDQIFTLNLTNQSITQQLLIQSVKMSNFKQSMRQSLCLFKQETKPKQFSQLQILQSKIPIQRKQIVSGQQQEQGASKVYPNLQKQDKKINMSNELQDTKIEISQL